MRPGDVQELCERGQEELMRMDYLAARETLEKAENLAWEMGDWDTLSRVYMPLQEVHRQIRQVCGEGVVCLDLWASGPGDLMEPEEVLHRFPQGQLLVAGWMGIGPAAEVRRLGRSKKLYVETFLGSVLPSRKSSSGKAIMVALTEGPQGNVVPDRQHWELVLEESEVPRGQRSGTSETFAWTMELWEKLHRPFLEAGDREVDPVRKMEKYRKTIEVDYACELAHQRLADVAREMSREKF